ncbi:helix-turn-helix domain-containing protein [Streptomyces sp. NPDC057638]|uniref:helix-turn-helix domain-containing protein n=1 Tax=Streptomyces sp. NPDC057638 TaxID=3346190 RepID=UPI00368410D0
MDNAAGKRVKSVRKRRGLSQRELAGLSGVSLSLIRKLEQGEYGTPRMESFRKLAVALQVPTMKLVTSGRHEGSSPEYDPSLWAPVQDALEHRATHADALDDPPTVRGTQGTLDIAAPLFRADQYAQLAAFLTSLLRDAEELGKPGRRIRSQALRMAGRLMVQTRHYNAAEIALTQALELADSLPDAAAAVSTRCWLLMRQGRLDTALALGGQWANEIEPRLSRATPDELASWGLLCLRVSAIAVRNNQDRDAEFALRMADSAAAAIGRLHSRSTDLSLFGPASVHLMRAEHAMVRDQPSEVLRLAEQTPLPLRRPGGSINNRHLLDVAMAYARTGRFAESFDTLQTLRGGAPEWLPHQRYARDVLRLVVDGRRTLTADMRSMVQFLRLPL